MFFLTCVQHLTLEERLWYHAQFLSAFLHRFHILPFNFALIRLFTCSLSSYYLHFWSLHDKCPVSLAYYHSIHSRSLFHLLIVAKLATTVLEFVPHPHMVYRFRLSYCFCYNHAFLNELDRSTDKKKQKTTTKNTIINWTGQLTGILSTSKRRICVVLAHSQHRQIIVDFNRKPLKTFAFLYVSKTTEQLTTSLKLCATNIILFFSSCLYLRTLFTLFCYHTNWDRVSNTYTHAAFRTWLAMHTQTARPAFSSVCDVCGARWCANN